MRRPLLPPHHRRRHPAGYVTMVATLVVGGVLLLMMLSAYRGAAMSRDVQTAVAVRVDLADKEDAVLRSIVEITPNRAIRAMQSGSDVAGVREKLSWQGIFTDALAQANARTSIDAATLATLGINNTYNGNPADTASNNVASIFTAISPDADYASAGINRSLGTGYPIPLQYGDAAKSNLDRLYPLIANQKIYGTLASGLVGADVAKYPVYNLIPYPNINFGYGAPGANFVAKRNWWAFSMNLGANDAILNDASRNANQGGKRDFVLSLYEIPSQLAISAETYANIGTHGAAAGGGAWQHAVINGGIFATRAQIDAGIPLARVAGRNGMTLANYNSVGANPLGGDPFAAGTREQYETMYGTSMPVYLSSDAGRSSFVPINAGLNFFDRYSLGTEANVIAGTTWNDYTSGAGQCAMRLDIIPTTPIQLRFSYLVGSTRVPSAPTGVSATTAQIATWESSSPLTPFSVKKLANNKTCVVVKPKLFPAYLAKIGASDVTVNNSIAINVDYTLTGVNNPALKPDITPKLGDCGVILSDCDDLTAYSKGFSLVTNLMLYIADDFNQVTTTAPTGSGLSSPFTPPTSIFAPDIRYGTDVAPNKVQISGQMGHMGGDKGGTTATRILDLQLGKDDSVAPPDSISVNLSPIVHPGLLPPITMKYWLVVLEERKREYYR
ncbi:MAG: hypothetical protein JWO82_1505 [Akkermansiaceae bacterium]|nr:hypothetical protein [Akkermansiaceae bacterium]